MAKIRGKRIYGTDVLPCTGPESVTGVRSCCLSKFMALSVAWVLVGVSCLYAQQSKPTEYQVKAAYLYNFGRFVKWPPGLAAGKGDSFPVCVLGRDPFGSILDSTLAGEALEGKPVVIRRIARPQDAADCRILFVSSTEENHLKEILAAIDQAGVLTVSDIPGFSRRGGMIQFVASVETRTRLELAARNKPFANARSFALVWLPR